MLDAEKLGTGADLLPVVLDEDDVAGTPPEAGGERGRGEVADYHDLPPGLTQTGKLSEVGVIHEFVEEGGGDGVDVAVVHPRFPERPRGGLLSFDRLYPHQQSLRGVCAKELGCGEQKVG